jgi:ubiquinone/menaquinone biosynthesis C-methylase UbiE
MKNILREVPSTDLHGLCLNNMRAVAASDLTDRNVLDIGCGFGWFELGALSRGVRAITGLELAEGDLKTARENIHDERVTLKVGSAIALPFEAAQFDTVVSWEVLEHIPKGTEPRMFAEARRVLKSGGAFYLSTPKSTFAGNVLDPAWWLVGHRHYSEKALAQFAEGAGLGIETLTTVGGWWMIASTLNMYVAKWIFRRGPFYRDLFCRRMDAELERQGFSNIVMKCVAN